MEPRTNSPERSERPPAQPPRVVGVQLDGLDHVEYVTIGRINPQIGDDVMIANRRGRRLGMVVTRPRFATPFEAQRGLGRLQRLADRNDVSQLEEVRLDEAELVRNCIKIARKHGLKLKILSAVRGRDGRLTIYFAADERLEFKEVGAFFSEDLRCRVELKEVSPRDAAKVLGAVGPCGRELCCSTFLQAPGGVSLKMAKAQGLSPHPSRLAGMCGRLKCCLKYEFDTYVGLGKALPGMGKTVMSVKGDGIVVRQNLLGQTVVLRLADNSEVLVTLEDLVDKKG